VTTGIVAAEIAPADPPTLAARWGEILERPPARAASGTPEIRLDLGVLRFVATDDRGGEGLVAVELAVTDPARLRAAAAARGLAVGDDGPTIGGMRFR
jgi:hypothetical protein